VSAGGGGGGKFGGRGDRRHSARLFASGGALLLVAMAMPIASAAAPAALNLASLGARPQGTYDASGNVSIRPTAYAFPDDAIFVATSGDDGSAGSEGAPLRTIERAIAVAPQGATIVLRDGVYRESVAVNKPVTLQPYPDEQVWLKGSDVIQDWSTDGSVWRHDGWYHELRSDTPAEGLDPAFPLAGEPEMVFVNGRPLRQVATKSAVEPGTFSVDEAADALYVGDDPTGSLVEAATRRVGINVQAPKGGSADGVVVRGLGFAHYATGYEGANSAALSVRTNFARIEHNSFSYNATVGAGLYGRDGVVQGNTFAYNGKGGMRGFGAHRMRFVSNVMSYNNQERFSTKHAAAGIKTSGGRDILWRDNLAEHNLAEGLWCDVSCYNLTAVHNVAVRNHSGMQYEHSAEGIIASNLVIDNNGPGIVIGAGSEDTRVYNNTLYGNAAQLRIIDDDRVSSEDPDLTWVTTDVTFTNNLIADTSSGSQPHIVVRDYGSNPLRSADDMRVVSDYNAYQRSPAATGTTLVEWWRGRTPAVHRTMADYHGDIGNEAHGFDLDGVATDNVFRNTGGGDFRLAADSGLAGRGEPLPGDIATAIGVPAGQPVDVGAVGDLRVPGRAADASPDATWWSTCETLACAFDAGLSSDPQDAALSYSWDFGDGGGDGGGVSPRHQYATPGTYAVTLTVTNADGATGRLTRRVEVTETAADNQNPVARFELVCDGMRCDFDGRGSSDPDGVVDTFSWTFEDGRAKTGPTPYQVFSRAGTYTVTLRVRDADGGSHSTQTTVTVGGEPRIPSVAYDRFRGDSATGWQEAELGGSYSLDGPEAAFSKGDGVGRMDVPSGGPGYGAYLDNVRERDVDAAVTVGSDSAAPGYRQVASLAVRRVSSGSEYRGQLQMSDAGVYLQLYKVVSGAATALGSAVKVSGVAHVVGQRLEVRLQATGANPTTLRMKVWRELSAEPAGWQVQGTDSTTVLQSAGGLGVHALLPSTAANAPVRMTFDNLSADRVAAAATGVTDRFERSTSGGWGRADTGGSYSHTGSGTAFAVTGGAGTVTLGSPNNVYGAYLNAVKIASVDLSVSVRSDKAASGYRQAVYLVARRVRSNTEYRVRVQATTSQLWLQLQKVIDGKSTSLGNPVSLPGISYVANKTLRLRLQATGTGPTTLRVKAWPAGTSEPGDWPLTRSDTQAALQAAGGVGLRAQLPADATNAPVRMSFDDLLVP